MKHRIVLQMEGGLGKQVALTALLPYFKSNYEEVIVLSSYPEVFENNPNVYRNISYQTPFAYEEYLKSSDDIVYPCGYRDTDFRKKRIGLIEAACRSVNIPYDTSMKPQIFLTKQEEKLVEQAIKDFGSYIILQTHGGMNPAAFLNGQKPNTNNVMAKDLDKEKAEEFVEIFKKEYPDVQILNYSIMDEAKVKGTVQLDFNSRIWMGLTKYCLTFLAIDSSLQHISAAFDKKGVVLWGATSPLTFGHPHNTNMENNQCCLNDYHCQRPYFVPSVDIKVNGISWECPNKVCMDFDMKQVFAEVKKHIPDIKFTTASASLKKFITE